MSEQPPIWQQPEEPPPAPRRHRSSGGLPVIPSVFAVAGLVLGILATLLISSMTGSHKTPTVAAAPISPATWTSAPGVGPSTSKPRPSPSRKPSGGGPAVLPPANEAGLSHAMPIAVQIPKIGVSSSLLNLGLNQDGTLQVPGDFTKAGWYAQGAYPGDRDEPPALIVGHVDNYRGPAVFYRLSQLGIGDRVLVPRSDGSTATFVVYKTQNFLKTSFPAQSVYAATGRPELRLITCTGQFDTGARSYLSNFVAYAYLSGGTG